MSADKDKWPDKGVIFGAVVLRSLEDDLARYRDAKAKGPEAVEAFKAELLARNG